MLGSIAHLSFCMQRDGRPRFKPSVPYKRFESSKTDPGASGHTGPETRTTASQSSSHVHRTKSETPVVAWVAFVCCFSCGSSPHGGVTTVASSLYARSDTNATTVYSPRVHVAGKIGESLGVDTAVALDSWTGASIDVTTAATQAIHEVRKEITVGGFYEFSDATLSGGYRYSGENDYWSNGGVVNLTVDTAENNTSLGLAVFGSQDVVGRAGDPGFKRDQGSLGARVSLTQVIDAKSLVQLSWETTRVSGYQAGPYRYVAISGEGTCASTVTPAPFCLPESVPGLRFRNAAIASGRRALGEHTSMGLSYRLYFDDWGLLSHTIAPDFTWLISEHATLSLNYRYYTQGAADFYRERYLVALEDVRSITRDRELSAMYSNRLGLGYAYEFALGDEGSTFLTAALRSGVTRYTYLAFLGLKQVDALEGTFLLSLDFR